MLLDVIVKPDSYKIKVIPSVAEYISVLRERMYELLLHDSKWAQSYYCKIEARSLSFTYWKVQMVNQGIVQVHRFFSILVQEQSSKATPAFSIHGICNPIIVMSCHFSTHWSYH